MAKKSKLPDVVIEVRGGVVQAVYTNTKKLTVTLVDWDNIREGGGAEKVVCEPFKNMDDETRLAQEI